MSQQWKTRQYDNILQGEESLQEFFSKRYSFWTSIIYFKPWTKTPAWVSPLYDFKVLTNKNIFTYTGSLQRTGNLSVRCAHSVWKISWTSGPRSPRQLGTRKSRLWRDNSWTGSLRTYKSHRLVRRVTLEENFNEPMLNICGFLEENVIWLSSAPHGYSYLIDEIVPQKTMHILKPTDIASAQRGTAHRSSVRFIKQRHT